MTEPITFTVIGLPQPAGSKRAFPFKRRDGKLGVAVSDNNPKAKDWKQAVASAAHAAHNGSGLLDGPLEVKMLFFLPRPKGHYRTGRNAGTLRESAPLFPTGRPDTQKLARGTTDALTKVIWRDDSQIVKEVLQKHYGEPARCEITITPLEPT